MSFWSTTLPDREQWEHLQALLESMPAIAPQHTFVIIADKNDFLQLSGLRMLRFPLLSGYFGLRRWYGKTLPALLQKENIEALITINGSPADASIPQLSVFISPSSALLACTTWLQFLYKTYLAKQLQRTAAIGIITSLQKLEIQKLYGIKEDPFFATGYAAPESYQPIDDWQRRETFLQKQTGGREYFLHTGNFSEEQFLHLLKAFSLFKKRQQSNMQLLVPVNFAIDRKLQEKLDSYKYRQDVQLITDTNKDLLPWLIACAYAVLFIEENSTTAFPVAVAMQCYVPVIGFKTNEALQETASEAALYADAPVESLAEQMKLIYKDEALRQSLIYCSGQKAQQVNRGEAARKILTQLRIS